MRSLIRELPYEMPIAAGRYRYERLGQPSGAVESWRLSHAADGYRFLRVDLNAERAESGHSYLYHLVLDAAGRPERLNFRFFGPNRTVRGLVLFQVDRVSLTREVNGQRLEEELPWSPERAFWFPASAGLSLLAGLGDGVPRPALTLASQEAFALWPTQLTVQPGKPETIVVMGKKTPTQPLTIRWAGEQRIIWLDHDRWPVKVRRGDLVAIESRYLRYQHHPTRRA